MVGPLPKLRVGTVPYLVARPLDLGLGEEEGIELTRDVPARLVESLRTGELDVALASSVESFRRPGYRYLAGLAVAGRGHVSSVQLFLRQPLDEIRTAALDPASRTARALCQCLLPDSVQWIEVQAGTDPRSVSADAWLRIGDVALREALGSDAPPMFNPSAAWTERTGLCFPFALWIVREGVDILPHLAAFRRARERGRAEAPVLAADAARAWGLPPDTCRRYLLEECLYEPGEDLAPALAAFADALVRKDLCPPGHQPQPIPVPEA
jgi:predicted solute-binding protein